jgi:hypothetical protein
MQGGRVAKGVRADGLSGERRQSGGRRRYVAFEDRPNAEAGDALAMGIQEQWRVWLAAVCPLTEIAAEFVRGLLEEFAARWQAPQIGRSITLPWPLDGRPARRRDASDRDHGGDRRRPAAGALYSWRKGQRHLMRH